MAGSFGHVHDPSQPNAFRFDLIENMGDAYEACEEMHRIILILARGNEKKLLEAIEESYEVERGERVMSPLDIDILPRED